MAESMDLAAAGGQPAAVNSSQIAESEASVFGTIEASREFILLAFGAQESDSNTNSKRIDCSVGEVKRFVNLKYYARSDKVSTLNKEAMLKPISVFVCNPCLDVDETEHLKTLDKYMQETLNAQKDHAAAGVLKVCGLPRIKSVLAVLCLDVWMFGCLGTVLA
eukprot:m.44469 g.44469  ORF g.44469 m.44469 type:complete len:163 (+) comp13015_c0_seq4:97-585(+)